MNTSPANLIPFGKVAREDCDHVVAGLHDHRCPACEGILRRCCASILGYPHHNGCKAVEQRQARAV